MRSSAPQWQRRLFKAKLVQCIILSLALLLLLNVWIHQQASQTHLIRNYEGASSVQHAVGASDRNQSLPNHHRLNNNHDKTREHGVSAHDLKLIQNPAVQKYLANVRQPTPSNETLIKANMAQSARHRFPQQYVAKKKSFLDFASAMPGFNNLSPQSPVMIWMPCFPGSGSELVLKILGALTGIPGRDIHSVKSGCNKPGTMVCKTHFPADGIGDPNKTQLDAQISPKVMLLVRNPATAIPSGHNWLWENDRAMRTHTEKMPLDYWRANRADVMDHGVFTIDKWFQVVDYWTSGNHSVGLTIPYEQLTNPETGPNLIKEMALFIIRQNHMDEHAFDEQLGNSTKLKDFWQSVVLGEAARHKRNTKRITKEDSYVPSYTADQKATLVNYIERIISKEALSSQLQSVLQTYIRDIRESPKIPTDTEEGILWSLKRNETWIKEQREKRRQRFPTKNHVLKKQNESSTFVQQHHMARRLAEIAPSHHYQIDHDIQKSSRKLGLSPTTVNVLARDGNAVIQYVVPSGRSCAINLYGLPRAFKSLVVPSLLKNIIAQNPTCDYFMHFYNKEQEGKSRSGQGGKLDSPETVKRALTEAVLQVNPEAIVRFDIDTDSTFQVKRRNIIEQVAKTKFTFNGTRQHLYIRGGKLPQETVNVLKMWHSQEAVWNLMKKEAHKNKHDYDYVAMLRNDVFFMTPINILDTSPFLSLANQTWAMAVVPGFGRFPVSDRMIYGPYSAVEPWASGRFVRLEEGAKLIQQMGPPPDLRPIIHSETFVSDIIFPQLEERGFFVVHHPTACFFRARADGTLWTSDCFKKSLPSIVRNLVGDGFNSVEKSYPRVKRLVEDILERKCGKLLAPKPRDGTWQMNCAQKDKSFGKYLTRALIFAFCASLLFVVYSKRARPRKTARSKFSTRAWDAKLVRKSRLSVFHLLAFALIPSLLGMVYIIQTPFATIDNQLVLPTEELVDIQNDQTLPLPSTVTQSVTQIGERLQDDLRTKTCAINFFGRPQFFESLSLPSIAQNVIAKNPTCDFYMHYYNSKQESTENIQEVFQVAVRRTNPRALMGFASDTEAGFVSKYNVNFQQEKKRIEVNSQLLASKVGFQEGEDLIQGRFFETAKLWHSQHAVWNLMKQSDKEYDYVAMLRSDMFYMTPINILDPSPFGLMANHTLSLAVVPGFSRIPVADRMIYGPYAAVEPWADNHLGNLKRILRSLRKTDVPAIHSESFVDAIVFPEIHKRGFFPVEHPHACFCTVGSNYTIQLSDCYWRSRSSIVFNMVGRSYNPIHRSYPKMKEKVEDILKRPCKRLVAGERKIMALDCGLV